jgi:hypothetical protein
MALRRAIWWLQRGPALHKSLAALGAATVQWARQRITFNMKARPLYDADGLFLN